MKPAACPFAVVVAQRSVHVGNVAELGDGGLAGLVHAGDAFAAVFLVDHEEDDRIERIVRDEAGSLQNEHSGYTSRD